MKELDFLEIIKNTLNDNSLLGDDCAYLEDLNIFVTQDTLAEDVHFSLDTTTPYLLGRKSVSVNLSDLAAALAKPLYISISVSLPSCINSNFISELYRGINDVCRENKVKVTGGDITGCSKLVISVCAIGKKKSKYLTSRSYAKKDDCVLITGSHGLSGAGLFALQNFLYAPKELVDAHLNPKARLEESKQLAKCLKRDSAVMDSSDGLADALFKIALASKRNIEIDINKIPKNNALIEFCKNNNKDYKDFIKWGAEDYELVVCTDEDTYQNLDSDKFICIGKVLNKDNNPCVIIKDNNQQEKITKEIFDKASFNHFKG